MSYTGNSLALRKWDCHTGLWLQELIRTVSTKKSGGAVQVGVGGIQAGRLGVKLELLVFLGPGV